MRKESVQKFDLEAAFKALNEVEIPVVKGIRPNRENLREKFNRKLVSDILVEDYFDVGDSGELEQAQEEREAEIAKAKLARIEKIVDLEAETEEDLLPSYVGKFIMQCPQCMMLFYKNEEDIEKSEENPEVVNLNEPCQHCGNSSGYTLVGKVDTVGEDEAAQYDVEDFGGENELDLNFDEEPAEETSGEETEEAGEDAATEEGNEEELELAPIDDEEASEESEEEEVKESLTEAASLNLDPAIASRFTKAQLDSLTPDEIKILQNPRDREGRDKIIAKYTNESLTEDIDKDLDAKLKAHNDYIEYLKDMISKEETSLANAKNEFVKKSIQSRIDALRADLEAALPEALKDEVTAAELPTPEEADMEAAAENKEDTKEKKESLTESLRTWVCVFDGSEIGTVEAENEEDAYAKMEQTWPELCYSLYDGVAEVWPENMDEALNKNLEESVDLFSENGTMATLINFEAIDEATRKEKLLSDPDFVEALKIFTTHYKMTASQGDLEDGVSNAEDMYDCVFEGIEGEDFEDTLAEIIDCYLAAQTGEDIYAEDITEAAPTTTSKLKRNLSTTEVMVKELKTQPMFRSLSTRTIQRVLLPYYIGIKGRSELSAQAMTNFFTEEGFAPFVLDHFFTIDMLARKELLKADAKFMKIFNAYAKKYKLFPTSNDEKGRGEDDFDYAFSIAFDLEDSGKAQNTQIARDTIKAFGIMYGNGEFDPAVVDASISEALTEAADDNLDALLDSEEFKEPISDKEIENIKAQYEGLEEEVAPGAESEMMMRNIVDTWESVEDLDDETFNKLTENYLIEVYSNVKSFEATRCDLKDNKLVIEGLITFNSGKCKSTTFIYEAKKATNNRIILEGFNNDFTSKKAFILSCKLDTANCLVVESLNYKYSINNTLVEGLVK
jgi:hypothetical protein